MPLTLPGDGQIIATRPNPSAQHVEDLVIVRSDALGTPVTADATGLRTHLGAAVPAGDFNIGNVDIVTVPVDPFGANADAATAGTGSMNAHLRSIANGVPITTSVVPGTSPTHLGKAYGGAYGATDTHVPTGFVRDDALTTLSDAELDYVPGRVDSVGRLWNRSVLDDGDGSVASLAPMRQVVGTLTTLATLSELLDSLHTTIITLSGVVRANGGTGTILGATLSSRHNTFAGVIKAYLFDSSVTGTTAGTALSISDTDIEKGIGTLEFDFSRSNGGVSRIANASRVDLPIPFKCNASVDDIFVILQLWSGTPPTFGASDLQLRVMIQPDS